MGRRKQFRPNRSVGLFVGANDGDEPAKASTSEVAVKDDSVGTSAPYYVEINKSNWISSEHLDLSEVVLSGLNLREGYSSFRINNSFYEELCYSVRFRLHNIDKFALDRMKLGHWPVLSSTDICLEFVEKCMVEGKETQSVILSGGFDGQDEAISGLVHLASMEFVTLRPVPDANLELMRSLRMRVEMLQNAFNSCESLLANNRQVWKKSMLNVMAWLRPEVITSAARYGFTGSMESQISMVTEMEEGTSNFRKRASFDVAEFYDAIKPSKSEPMLEDNIPDLLPALRPYQRRAAYWMLQREKGDSESSTEVEKSHFVSPLSIPVDFLDSSLKMFYNPFSGNISLHCELSSPHVFGGILADEMGLGKTIELLSLVFVNPKLAIEEDPDFTVQGNDDKEVSLKRLKRERVECVCGAVTESYKYKGLWVQCDICDAWQHADCVGYSPRGKKKMSALKLEKHRKKTTINFVQRDGDFICKMCSELLQATDSPIATGATLVVCPPPILPQWHSEIIRYDLWLCCVSSHTRPGSLKVCVYNGVRDLSFSNASVVDIGELINADIVLTTYDVLKEDLSHDSDRHEGDRHCLRFQKRYPVIPTPLTRIFWWRICLDEAQMVESNAAATTEMALRLSAKNRWCITGTPIQRKLDDLYGLLRFIKASPFNISRWWIDVIRDQYERKDLGAMEYTHKLFKQLMWRSSKAHVADELQLPPQEQCVSWLTFSAIEEHFYQRQHETCASYACEVIGSLKNDILQKQVSGCLSSDTSVDPVIAHAEAAKLFNSLLKLRQACCHPQVGSSGLRSLQQSPMTMEEILMVLISKTKIEGEEALRKFVIALNALAAISIIENKFSQALSLYKEAMELTEEHSEDFRLDPLLNIHIHHNLAEILPWVPEYSSELTSEEQFTGGPKSFRIHSAENGDVNAAKRRKVSREGNSEYTKDTSNISNLTKSDQEGNSEKYVSSRSFNIASLQAACENLKQNYLSVFSSRISLSQQDFGKSYMQVCNALNDNNNGDKTWWLDALHQLEQSKDSAHELMRKIEEAIAGTLNKSRSSKSHFRSITTLKYYIQTHLDQLEVSRKNLLDRLLEIDQTMEKPKEEDIERVRYCRICQGTVDGPICVHCELDELFQDYEVRLFRFNKSHGEVIISAEDAVDLRKKNSELNRFYSKLSLQNKNRTASGDGNEETRKRDGGERVVVSKSPSELEVILGVVRNYCKAHLGKQGVSGASWQLHILEGMRKEYSHARSLAVAQAQLLRAHDEIKMATSRLHLKEDENDISIDALGPEELEYASVLHTNDKFMSLTLLSRVKGKLRYLKGLVLSKQKSPSESSTSSSLTQEMTSIPMSAETMREDKSKVEEEICPICQEKLNNQKMVFQCGHFTCCKCLFALTEKKGNDNKFQLKWVMCPTCRQHTDFGNIAYVDDRQDKTSGSDMPTTVQDSEMLEASLTVQGSYGTKIEAVTKRILGIKSSDPDAKVLVFSSWNDVLDVLEHALNANDISYVRMKGGRKAHVAISEFRGQKSSEKTSRKQQGRTREQKPVQVLLLLIQHGANGLNLLEAQHVVLVEPLLNPAAEAQAISRVHRIGQGKRTLVHRFIVKDTVEESIYKLNRSRNSNSFISGNTKNQDQPVLTLKDLETLFASVRRAAPKSDEQTESLRHLPPSVAAAIAAERRLKE